MVPRALECCDCRAWEGREQPQVPKPPQQTGWHARISHRLLKPAGAEWDLEQGLPGWHPVPTLASA